MERRFRRPFQMPEQKQVQPNVNTDRENMIVCDCGNTVMEGRVQAFKVPSQVLGGIDITFKQVLKCDACGAVVDPLASQTIGQLEDENHLDESKEEEDALSRTATD